MWKGNIILITVSTKRFFISIFYLKGNLNYLSTKGFEDFQKIRKNNIQILVDIKLNILFTIHYYPFNILYFQPIFNELLRHTIGKLRSVAMTSLELVNLRWSLIIYTFICRRD